MGIEGQALVFIVTLVFTAVIFSIPYWAPKLISKRFDKFESGLKWLRERNEKPVEQFRIGPNQLRLATNKKWYLFETDKGRAIATKNKNILEAVKQGCSKENIKIPYL